VNWNFQRRVKQLYPKIKRNARKMQGFACLATPDPTLPASLHECWNSIVGSGLLDRLTPKSAGVKDKDKNETSKNTAKGKVKSNGNTNTVENPPNNLLVMKQVKNAGFSTPFPEGGPVGACYFLNLINGGKPW
jgi:hypothetical protein